MTLFVTPELAARIELLGAAENRRFAETARAIDPESRAEWLEVAGGVAAFVAPGSPVNRACGLGFRGPVEAEEIAAVGEFFLRHDAVPLVSVAPNAHPSLVAGLGEAGYVADGFENVLVRRLTDDDVLDADESRIEIREVTEERERERWALVAATGFSDPLPPLAEQIYLGTVVVSRPGVRLYLAYVDGMPAGTGELATDGGVAWLSADTTLPQFRRLGVQQALQRHRLAVGAQAGCDLAVTESMPGSPSQRNMERLGFRVAYSRIDLLGPVAPA